MSIEFEINGSADAGARYVSYAPSPCRVRQTDLTSPREVTLRSESVAPGGGEAVFYASPDAASQETITLDVPPGDEGAELWIGGKWEHPSVEDRDCRVVAECGGAERGSVELMVRVRKNANLLLPAERDRFVAAFGRLNNGGQGPFAAFREMHRSASSPQAHGGPQFLPWHRAYLLDLERELQAIDPSVSLHYWRWDEPAPNLFQRNFIGVAELPSGRVQFTPGHPLDTWMTDGRSGIVRVPYFDTATSRATGPFGTPVTQSQTLAIGDTYGDFRRPMEVNPHGSAHISFRGYISQIATAARDPLFFMLHSNVDRLWALWQWRLGLTDPASADAYREGTDLGTRLADTMWPWNGDVDPPRPDYAPGGGLADSPVSAAPGAEPTVGAMIDFQGRTAPPDRLGYGYDTVPYEHE